MPNIAMKIAGIKEKAISIFRSDIFKILVPVIISIVALIVAIRSDCHNKIQDEKYEKLVYLQNATMDSPILELINPLDDLRWDFAIKSFDFSKEKGMPEIKFDVTIKGNLKLKNTGKSNAHLRAVSVIDSFTASPILRYEMLDEDKRKNWQFYDMREKEFFYKRTILPGAEDSVNFEKKIRYFSQDSVMVVHIILLYEDDMDALFDTYYWVKINSKKIELRPKGGIINKNGFLMSYKFAVNDLVEPIQDNTDYFVYKFDQRNSIFAWLKEAEEELKKGLK